MELPYGFENRHNAVDPTAAVFSKKVVSVHTAAQVRDDAVRRKYLAMTVEEARAADAADAAATAPDTGGGGGDSRGGGGGCAKNMVSLPVGWGARTAASTKLTSPAAMAVNWSSDPAAPRRQQPPSGSVRAALGDGVGGGGGSGDGDGSDGGTSGGGGVRGGQGSPSVSSQRAAMGKGRGTGGAAAAAATAVEAGAGSGPQDSRQEMAGMVLRLHQIAQQEAALAAERKQLLQQLSMLIAGGGR